MGIVFWSHPLSLTCLSAELPTRLLLSSSSNSWFLAYTFLFTTFCFTFTPHYALSLHLHFVFYATWSISAHVWWSSLCEPGAARWNNKDAIKRIMSTTLDSNMSKYLSTRRVWAGRRIGRYSEYANKCITIRIHLIVAPDRCVHTIKHMQDTPKMQRSPRPARLHDQAET